MGSREWKFPTCGRTSAQFADDIAVVRSCYHESFIHGPALSMLHSGSLRLGYPSLGAWVLYGWEANRRTCPPTW